MESKGVLKCSNKVMQFLGTLNGGQSFRWKNIKLENTDKWVGVFRNKLWVLQQKDDCIDYNVYSGKEISDEPSAKKPKSVENNSENNKLLGNYLRLDYDLPKMYKEWGESDPHFLKAAEQFYGIRILNQEIVENIFSFICSSNNNISRISKMVEKLATLYGDKICDFEDVAYHTFPKIESLAPEEVEAVLRKNGFGYRAKYIQKSAETIVKLGADKWIQNLKEMDYNAARNELMTLPGIGAKIADCICLMSLGHLGAIPVDTHIFQIAAKLYLPHLRKNKMNTKVYDQIAEHFRNIYGPNAGWAHVILFCYDLKNIEQPAK